MKLLHRNDYMLAIPLLKEVTFNNLFARSVVEQHVDGMVYTDNLLHPKAFYVIHPYGMSLLYGNVSDEFLQAAVKDHSLDFNGRKIGEWLQVFPSDLEDRIDNIIGNEMRIFDSTQDQENSGSAVVKHQRINFKFNHRKFDQFRNKVNLNDYIFCNVDKYLFNETNGSVVPNNFWNNASEFLKQGVGISLMVEGQAVAVTFSSFMHDNMLELGMETKLEYRRRNFASIVTAKLIEYCIEKELEPVWSCRRGNQASYNLAIKLGFEPTVCLPYYELLM